MSPTERVRLGVTVVAWLVGVIAREYKRRKKGQRRRRKRRRRSRS